MSKFIHLHNHTSYSLLDGACRIDDIIETCEAFGMDTFAITDHGNMFGAIHFYLAMKKKGLKPIIGAEVYVAPQDRTLKEKTDKQKDTSYHLVLLAKNFEGYQNLMELVSRGYTEGFYYKPRIDKTLLRQYSSGLIAMSACISGEIARKIRKNDMEAAEKAALEYRGIFGEDFYLEIQRHGIEEEEKVVQGMAEINRKHGIPLVATNDIHYLKKEHARAHEILLCIQTGKTLKDTNRMRFNTDQVYFKSQEDLDEIHLPEFELPAEYQHLSLDEYLRLLAEEGLKKRYSNITPKLEQRLEQELGIIKKMGYAGYFLIVKDFIDHAREEGIPVGPGRGSAAGSLVSYCLRITNIEPMQYDLLFERFLNPDRVSMPDIDIDFCYERREEIIQYVKDKYGEENVTQIITFGTMAARGVIRDVARVLDIELSEADKIAKLIPQGPKITLTKALEEVPKLREYAQKGGVYKDLIDNALVLEGLHRHASVHAAGVVITPGKLTQYTPLHKSPQKDTTTQYDGKTLEKIGILKMDFLGLRNLTVIHDTVEQLKPRGINIDPDSIPLDDKETLKLFGRGETVGVFQFESSGMRNSLMQLQPQNIGDLIAMNALYRPGPMDHIPDFINRRHGRTPITFAHPKLEPILKETYGIIVYQEQVMRVASELAGFSMAKADELRRAMGKKIKSAIESLKVEFIDGAVKNGVAAADASKIYDLIEKFAEYGFNKSHAAGYSVLAFQTAYLKTHYPAEFMAANLTSEMNSSDRVVILIEECKRMGLEVLPPDINFSDLKFTVENGKIRFGLLAIKNVGKNAIKSIIETRKENGTFKTIFELCEYVDLRQVNKKVLESLAQAGAMDSLEGNRHQLFLSVDTAIHYGQQRSVQRAKGQTSIFGANPETQHMDVPPLPAVSEWPEREKLNYERSVLGFYLSGHPLSQYAFVIKLFSCNNLNELNSLDNEMPVRIGARVINVKQYITKNKKPMAFVSVEDLTESGEVIVFPEAYDKFRDFLQEDQLIFIIGQISKREEDETAKIICRQVIPFDQVWNRLGESLHIRINEEQVSREKIFNIKNLLMQSQGKIPVYLDVRTQKNGTYTLRSRRIFTQLTLDLAQKLSEQVGKDNIWVE
ncbi:DNA polymerase III subunit alpha [candidate division KSB1 bacterium 4484_87]|nr:MAG: DNA polymerase III subunit alpha [candidate division KSB1 bacterium 4484_87]